MPGNNDISIGIAALTQLSAANQSFASLETYLAHIVNTYADVNGNITSVDVTVPGQPNQISNVPNYSGINISKGDQVTLNFNKGNKHAPQVIQAGGANAATAATNAAAISSSGQTTSINNPSNAGSPVTLERQSATFPSGYVLTAGSNVYFVISQPYTGSGGNQINGDFEIFALILRLTSLPDPTTTSYQNGTLVELIDSYDRPLGLYQLVSSIPEWQLISGSGAPTYFNQNCTGSGTAWVLPRVPTVGVVIVADGITLKPTTDYTISGANISLVRAALNWVMGAVLQ